MLCLHLNPKSIVLSSSDPQQKSEKAAHQSSTGNKGNLAVRPTGLVVWAVATANSDRAWKRRYAHRVTASPQNKGQRNASLFIIPRYLLHLLPFVQHKSSRLLCFVPFILCRFPFPFECSSSMIATSLVPILPTDAWRQPPVPASPNYIGRLGS